MASVSSDDCAGTADDGPRLPLRRLAEAVPGAELTADAVVGDLAYDSRRTRPGSLFFALPGRHRDGHDHAAAAVAGGASAVVVERPLDLPVPQLRVPSTRRALAAIAAAFYGHPSERLTVVGVTGTNGKTTTCTVLRHCLDAAGVPAGQVGTIGARFGTTSLPTSLTTPEAPDLQKTLFEMATAGVSAVAMEASSHGLDQGRLDGVKFEVGIFTNLSREHLDYHGTMARYWRAKRRLFEPDRCRRALVGVDDEWGRRMAADVSVPVLTFGFAPEADVRISADERGLDGLKIVLRGDDEVVSLTTRIVGRVNAANVAAAFLAARQLGVPADRAAAGIAGADPPPGRFEVVGPGHPLLVVVDYAHTPDALAALLGTARRLADGRVTVVLGARGHRDRGKRPLLGRASAAADRVVLTTDSPADEPVASIIEAIHRGLREVGHPAVVVEPDRRAAIETAVGDAAPGDVVLIVGRGDEQFQHIGEATVRLDDREAALEALGAAGTWDERCA
ncbi:MAG: UDP-N-acetylmuramoyl-L-alanyl-D-glutamate--2,6-diaminopimelate ligase [Acidimicrobiales bacterium]